MIIGGTAGSTSGGIKTLRAVMVVKGVGWWLKKIALPEEAVIPFRTLKENVLNSCRSHCFSNLWVVFLLVGVIVLLRMVPAGFNLGDVILEGYLHRAIPGYQPASPPKGLSSL